MLKLGAGDRTALQGALAQGHLDGPWRAWRPDGTLEAEVSFCHGQLHGLATWFHPNGQPRARGEYNAGARYGQWRFWDAQGVELGTLDHGPGDAATQP